MTHASDEEDQSRSRLLRLMLEQVEESAFIFLDPQGQIVDWSSGAEKLFGYVKAEAAGQNFTRLFTPTDRNHRIADLEMSVACADAISEDDRWHLRKDGSTFWSTGSLTALRDENLALIGYVKILRDRTNLKEQL